jgi:hypothetical protein
MKHEAMKNIYPFLLLGLTLFVQSCGADAAKDVVDTFHLKLIEKDFSYICDNLLDEEALKTTSRAQWIQVFESITSTGEITNIEQQPGFKSNSNDGITRVLLKYSFMLGEEKMYERIITIDRGEGTKIRSFAINSDEAQVESLVADF